jgi:subtilisin family serine protease
VLLACTLLSGALVGVTGGPSAATESGADALAPSVADVLPTKDVAADDVVDGEVLVTWRDDATAAEQREVRSDADLVTSVTPVPDTELATITDGSSVAEVVEELQDDPAVESVQPNYRYRRAADQYYGLQWGLNNTGQTVGNAGISNIDVDAPQAWTSTTGSSSTIVAVIDTGVQITHPDLASRIWVNTAEKNGTPGVDDDGNGYVDDVNGWDFDDDDASVYDGEYCAGYGNNDDHGTHVAGIIGASRSSGSGSGIAGVAPNVTLLPLKILGCSTGSTVELIAAISYARAKGAKIVNLSLGGAARDPYLYDAIKSARSAGMLFVAAAGNGNVGGGAGSRCSSGGGDPVASCPMYPAAFDLDNIISVGAVTNRGSLASFSQYGATGPGGSSATGVDVAAPGVNILSTVPDGYGASATPSWNYLSGTSMAAPFVTGVAALAKSKAPSWTATQVRARVLSAGRSLPALSGTTVTGRLVNAANTAGRTGLSVRTTTPSTLPGQLATVGTTLTSGATLISGRAIHLERYAAATGTWVRMCTTTTRADGSAWCSRPQSVTTTYRWRFLGDGYFNASTSPTVRVGARPRVTLTPQTVVTSLGRRVVFLVTVAPGHAGRPVAVQRWSNGRWVTVATRTLNASSQAGASIPMTARGVSYWRAYFGGDSDHVAAASITNTRVTTR